MKDNFDTDPLTKSEFKKLNSRNKGNAFERKVCEILNERFGTKDFMRSPGSGAFATTHKLPEHLKIYGDLITPNNFSFTIECKKGYNKENLGNYFSSKSIIKKFLEQASNDALKSKKHPLLIWQQDRADIIVFVPAQLIVKHNIVISYPYITLGDKWVALKLVDFLTLHLPWFNSSN